MSTIKTTQISALTESTSPTDNDVLLIQDAESGATQKMAYGTLLKAVASTNSNTTDDSATTQDIAGINVLKSTGVFAKKQTFDLEVSKLRTESYIAQTDSYVNCHFMFQLASTTTASFDDSVCIFAKMQQNASGVTLDVPICKMPINGLTANKTYQIDLHCEIEAGLEIYGGLDQDAQGTLTFSNAKLHITTMTETEVGNYDIQRVLKDNLGSTTYFSVAPIVFNGETTQKLSVGTDADKNYIYGQNLSSDDDGVFYILNDENEWEKNENITTTTLSNVIVNEPFNLSLTSFYNSTLTGNYSTIEYKVSGDTIWHNIGNDSRSSTTKSNTAYNIYKGTVAFDKDDVVSVQIGHSKADSKGYSYVRIDKLSQLDHNTDADCISSKTQILNFITDQVNNGNATIIKSKNILWYKKPEYSDNAMYLISSHGMNNSEDIINVQCGPIKSYGQDRVFYPSAYYWYNTNVLSTQNYDITSYIYGLENTTFGTSAALTTLTGWAASTIYDIYLPSSLTGTMSAYTFYNNSITSLNSLSNTQIYNYNAYAIGNLTGLTELAFPYGTYRIVNNAVYNCTKLSSLVIPDSIGLTYGHDGEQVIQISAFNKCTLLNQATKSNIYLMLSGNSSKYLTETATSMGYEIAEACKNGLSSLYNNTMLKGRRMYIIYNDGTIAKFNDKYYMTDNISCFNSSNGWHANIVDEAPL